MKEKRDKQNERERKYNERERNRMKETGLVLEKIHTRDVWTVKDRENERLMDKQDL